MTELPEGILPVLATPFRADGSVDETSFTRQVDFCIQANASGLVMFGLASEYYKLSGAERDRLAMLTVEAAAGRVPVILSVTPHAKELAVEEARRFAGYGPTALMVMPPFLFGVTEQAVLAHVQAIAAAVDLPLIVQYAPLQTGCRVSGAQFIGLAGTCPRIQAVKVDTVPAGPYLSELSGRLATYCGYMGTHLPEAVTRNVSGCMPTGSLSAAFVTVWRLLHEQPSAGREMHSRMLPLLSFMMQSVEFLIACEKRLLQREGIFPDIHTRSPFAVLDPWQERELSALLSVMSEWLLERTQ